MRDRSRKRPRSPHYPSVFEIVAAAYRRTGRSELEIEACTQMLAKINGEQVLASMIKAFPSDFLHLPALFQEEDGEAKASAFLVRFSGFMAFTTGITPAQFRAGLEEFRRGREGGLN